MKEHNIDVFGISEININPRHHQLYRTLQQNLRNILQQNHASILATNTNVTWPQQYQPGGVMIIANDRVT